MEILFGTETVCHYNNSYNFFVAKASHCRPRRITSRLTYENQLIVCNLRLVFIIREFVAYSTVKKTTYHPRMGIFQTHHTYFALLVFNENYHF